jgi:hypothetical protein
MPSTQSQTGLFTWVTSTRGAKNGAQGVKNSLSNLGCATRMNFVTSEISLVFFLVAMCGPLRGPLKTLVVGSDIQRAPNALKPDANH